MLNRNKNGLIILDNLSIDKNLPKYKNKENLSQSSRFVNFDGLNISGSNFITGGFDSTPSDETDFNDTVIKKSFLDKIKLFFSKNSKKNTEISVQDFFKLIKESSISIDIDKYSNRVNEYLVALNNAIENNQDALADELKIKIQEVKNESLLFAGGFKTVITEEQVIKFYKECKKGLELTYIRNFTRIIPNKASEKKKEADLLNVFDNYVILHYDPEKKAFKEEEKDPILFGVISGSRKLYYIADWIDEYCDLTLEQFVEKFGEDAITANDISVNLNLK